MPKELVTGGNFALKRIGIEGPPIANTKFATFFGDGTLNTKDSTNLVAGSAGGTTFSNVGSGPVLAPAYGTFTPATNGMSTGMGDNVNGWCFLFVGAAPQVTFATVARLSGTIITWGTGQALNVISGVAMQGGGTIPSLAARPAFPTQRMYALVVPLGAQAKLYDLTSGDSSTSPTNVNATSRPTAGNWEIGPTTPSGGSFVNPCRVSFAFGAWSAPTLTDLNALAAALRPTLAARGIAGV